MGKFGGNSFHETLINVKNNEFTMGGKLVRINTLTVIVIILFSLTFSTVQSNVQDTMPATPPPVADAGPDQTVQQYSTVNFDGSWSVGAGGCEILGYWWNFTDIVPVTLTGVSPNYTFTNSGVFTVTLTIQDAIMQMDTDWVVVTVEKVNATVLEPGWNLISFPTVENDWNTSVLFGDIQDEIELIQTYETVTGTWKSFSYDYPVWLNTLNSVSEKMGIWVKIKGDDRVPLIFDEPFINTSTVIQLNKGWNLVGYPSQDNLTTISEILSGIPWDMVETFSDILPYNLKDLTGGQYMSPGCGYWVHVTADCTWTVEP